MLRRRSATAHQGLEAQSPAMLAANEQMHAICAHLVYRRSMPREIELPNRCAETLPLRRRLPLARRMHFKILDRHARRLRMQVEFSAREMGQQVGLRAYLPRRDIARERRLREGLQRRQFDLLERDI